MLSLLQSCSVIANNNGTIRIERDVLQEATEWFEMRTAKSFKILDSSFCNENIFFLAGEIIPGISDEYGMIYFFVVEPLDDAFKFTAATNCEVSASQGYTAGVYSTGVETVVFGILSKTKYDVDAEQMMETSFTEVCVFTESSQTKCISVVGKYAYILIFDGNIAISDIEYYENNHVLTGKYSQDPFRNLDTLASITNLVDELNTSDGILLEQLQEKTTVFEHENLLLKITNVILSETLNGIDDGGNTRKYYKYILNPGALITVVEADMTDGNLTENGQPHSNWSILLKSGNRIPITNDIHQVEVKSDVLGIVNNEAGVYVLTFEIYADN